MSKPDLAGYVDVAARLRLALACHPMLRVTESAPIVRNLGERAYIEVAVTVHRDPDDTHPVTAHAWEPWPGRTPFTRDSEMMNAATSALGRALGYMGYGIDRGLATVDEITNRQDIPQEAPQRPVEAAVRPEPPSDGPPPTERQLNTLHAMCRERGLNFDDWTPATADDASILIERIKAVPKARR